MEFDEADWPLSRQIDLIGRAYELRKRRLIEIVFVVEGRIYLSLSEVDPWGHRYGLSWEGLEGRVLAAERMDAGEALRKGVYGGTAIHGRRSDREYLAIAG